MRLWQHAHECSKLDVSGILLFIITGHCRFAEGHCPFGDRCNYAHGEADLRVLPPEGQQILENRAGKARLPGDGGSPTKLPANSLAGKSPFLADVK